MHCPSRILALAITFLLSACSSTFITPGKPVDFSVINSEPVAQAFAVKPALTLPANIVAVRAQGPAYRNNSVVGYGNGKYTIVSERFESEDRTVEKIEKLPGVSQVGVLNRLLIPEYLASDAELRAAAARMGADLILLYTFATHFNDDDILPPLSILTLGFSPTQTYKVTSTASAILMDVKTGYVYASVEESETKSGIATAWNTTSAMESARIAAEKKALRQMLEAFEKAWSKSPLLGGPALPGRGESRR